MPPPSPPGMVSPYDSVVGGDQSAMIQQLISQLDGGQMQQLQKLMQTGDPTGATNNVQRIATLIQQLQPEAQGPPLASIAQPPPGPPASELPPPAAVVPPGSPPGVGIPNAPPPAELDMPNPNDDLIASLRGNQGEIADILGQVGRREAYRSNNPNAPSNLTERSGGQFGRGDAGEDQYLQYQHQAAKRGINVRDPDMWVEGAPGRQPIDPEVRRTLQTMPGALPEGHMSRPSGGRSTRDLQAQIEALRASMEDT